MPIMSEGKKNKNQLNSAPLVNIINKHVLKKENTFVIVEQVVLCQDKELPACLILVKLLDL